jgi:hypothetical protein
MIALQADEAAAYHTKQHIQRSRQMECTRISDCAYTNEGRQICGTFASAAPVETYMGTGRVQRTSVVAEDMTVIGSRPAGCPHAYCGCGLRMYLGIADDRLNLASNWARLFPRESGPRPGLAAVRNHHVMYIEASAGDGLWRVRDYNSGGGLSRIHVTSVRGFYTFVNPHAGLASRQARAVTVRRQAAAMVANAEY